jgi:ornithine--oxo-acid transaminase
MANNAMVMGETLRKALEAINSPIIEKIRGKGLLNAIVIDESKGVSAYDLCYAFKKRGLLAKPTHGNIIRLAPPLVINEEQMQECIQIIKESIESFHA